MLQPFIFFLVFIINCFYLRVFRYPKGPFPYPIIGNLTYMKTLSSVNPHRTLSKLNLTFGSIFTVWMSHKPFVFIADAYLVKTSFQKPEFSDRGFKYIGKLFTMDRGHDFIFNDYNRVNMDQRKIVQTAIRKYLITDELNKATSDCVDEFWNDIKRQGLENPIDMRKYLHLIITKIMARSLFGARYKLNDPELMQLKNGLKNAARACDLMIILDGLPKAIGQFFFDQLAKTSWLGTPVIVKTIEMKFQQHLDSYKNGRRIRDVTDALIAAKAEAILDDSESGDHLVDQNLKNILNDLFIAGIDTTNIMCEWIFLLMAKHPAMQSRMRREIRRVVGQLRKPTQEDKNDCHFTMAFINEALRLHAPVPFSVAHQTKIDVEIDGSYKIPRRTTTVNYSHGINRNADYWRRPDLFDPNRMLDADGKLLMENSNKQQLFAFMPFGSGRRACPGEKLAQIDGFLIVARMLQLTNEFKLQFASDSQPIVIEPDPKLVTVLVPVHYNLVLKPFIET